MKKNNDLKKIWDAMPKCPSCGRPYLGHPAISRKDNKTEICQLMSDPEFAFEAFKYEMFNHEYPINWQGDWDVCECFNYTGKELEYVEGKSGIEYLHELGYPNAVLSAYRRAAREVWESQDW